MKNYLRKSLSRSVLAMTALILMLTSVTGCSSGARDPMNLLTGGKTQDTAVEADGDDSATLSGEAKKASNLVILTSPVKDAVVTPQVYRDFIRPALENNDFQSFAALGVLDGIPEILYEKSLSDMNTNRFRSRIEKSLEEAAAMMATQAGKIKAREPEMDLMAGLYLADHYIHAKAQKGTLFLDCNCLSTSGDLDLSGHNLLTMDTGAVISELKEKRSLPDLSGIRVICCNIGETDPHSQTQVPLNQAMKSALEDFVKELLTACGAESVLSFHPVVAGGFTASEEEYPEKTPVMVYRALEDQPDGDYTQSYDLGEKQLSFQANTDVLLTSREEAAEILRPLITAMKEDLNYRVIIAGGTSSFGEMESSLTLSAHRAQAVADLLVSEGVPENQIEGVYGLAFKENSPLYKNDRDENGNLVESLAAENRVVCIAGINSEKARRILEAV